MIRLRPVAFAVTLVLALAVLGMPSSASARPHSGRAASDQITNVAVTVAPGCQVYTATADIVIVNPAHALAKGYTHWRILNASTLPVPVNQPIHQMFGPWPVGTTGVIAVHIQLLGGNDKDWWAHAEVFAEPCQTTPHHRPPDHHPPGDLGTDNDHRDHDHRADDDRQHPPRRDRPWYGNDRPWLDHEQLDYRTADRRHDDDGASWLLSPRHRFHGQPEWLREGPPNILRYVLGPRS